MNTMTCSKSGRSGQTLVISIIVMFLLAVLAGVFVALVARNLGRAKRMSSSDVVYQIAETGIKYADTMLTSGEDGADWRPVPDNTPALAGSLSLLDNDPDFNWTRPYSLNEAGTTGPTGGYTTIRTDQGRFLLRVSYNPNPLDPLSKYIKIESIGRYGPGIEYMNNNNNDPDPTTFANAGDSRLKRYLVAYKPIGITDYGMFITNKYNRSTEFGLGCPNITESFGRDITSPNGHRGFPIRVNGNLSWFGSNTLFLRRIAQQAGDTLPIDAIEVTGDILPADSLSSVNIQPMTPTGATPGGSVNARWSDDSGFDSVYGQWRDGSESTDVNMRVRSIKRIDPPLLSQQDITGTSERYLVSTYYSGTFVTNSAGQTYNSGYIGWGRGIYINNGAQASRIGYDDLYKEWMDTGGLGDWIGSVYVPGNAVMLDLQTDGIHATRGVRDTRQWQDANGNFQVARTIVFDYPPNGVLYATGDMRIKGMLPQNTQLTVVSGGNIYIEGNLLKFRPTGGNIISSDPWKGADERCSLALLAKKNVVINTTQFIQCPDPQDAPADPQLGDAPYPIKLYADNTGTGLWFNFDFGPFESETPIIPGFRRLFLKHAGEYRPAYLNGWLNDVPLSFSEAKGVPNNISPVNRLGVGDNLYGYGGGNVGLDAQPAFDVFTIDNVLMSPMTLSDATGDRNYLYLGMDPNRADGNYLFWGMTLQPMDVRIEALCYAEEGSLFVIPGEWLNSNQNDTRASYNGGKARPSGVDAMFPFYGEPLDIRIIIDGAVSQNQPAPMTNIEEWMRKWGRIPATYGSSSVATAHPGEGFTILYDDHCGWPLNGVRTGGTALRVDAYGRALPYAPKLPVSSTLIFSGDTL